MHIDTRRHGTNDATTSTNRLCTFSNIPNGKIYTKISNENVCNRVTKKPLMNTESKKKSDNTYYAFKVQIFCQWARVLHGLNQISATIVFYIKKNTYTIHTSTSYIYIFCSIFHRHMYSSSSKMGLESSSLSYIFFRELAYKSTLHIKQCKQPRPIFYTKNATHQQSNIEFDTKILINAVLLLNERMKNTKISNNLFSYIVVSQFQFDIVLNGTGYYGYGTFSLKGILIPNRFSITQFSFHTQNCYVFGFIYEIGKIFNGI